MTKYEAKLTFKGRLLLFALSNPLVKWAISKFLNKKIEEFLKNEKR